MRSNIIPSQFHRFIDLNYQFAILDSFSTIEIEVGQQYVRVARFNQLRSHTLYQGMTIAVPESICFRYQFNNNVLSLLLERTNYPALFSAGRHLSNSILAGHRKTKYLELYKAYECLLKPNDRYLNFASIRHSLSHSSKELTRQPVIDKLFEMFDGLEIDLSSYRHQKLFFTQYWELLIEVDKLIFGEIQTLWPTAKDLVKGIRILK